MLENQKTHIFTRTYVLICHDTLKETDLYESIRYREKLRERLIELLEFDDPDLNLWSYKVTDVDYGEDVSPRCYYEGRTVGCRIKETVLDEFEQL